MIKMYTFSIMVAVAVLVGAGCSVGDRQKQTGMPFFDPLEKASLDELLPSEYSDGNLKGVNMKDVLLALPDDAFFLEVDGGLNGYGYFSRDIAINDLEDGVVTSNMRSSAIDIIDNGNYYLSFEKKGRGPGRDDFEMTIFLRSSGRDIVVTSVRNQAEFIRTESIRAYEYDGSEFSDITDETFGHIFELLEDARERGYVEKFFERIMEAVSLYEAEDQVEIISLYAFSDTFYLPQKGTAITFGQVSPEYDVPPFLEIGWKDGAFKVVNKQF